MNIVTQYRGWSTLPKQGLDNTQEILCNPDSFFHISASQQYPFSLCVSVELNAAILELIERSRFRRNEPVCVKLNRIQQVYNSTQFLEVVKGLTQQNEQVNIADYVSSVARHRAIQNQALKP